MTDPGRFSRGVWEGEAPPITAQPERNLGGSEAILRERAGRPTAIIRASGSSLYSHTVTVNLGLGDLIFPDGVTGRRANILALVEWGQGGGSFRAEVDVKEGSALTVVATFLNISAMFDPDDPAETPDVRPESAVVTAALIWGSRPGGPIPTRTQRRAIPSAGSAIVPIPNFARSLGVSVGDSGVMAGTTPGLDLTFLGGPAATDLALLSLAGASGILQESVTGLGICFPEGARFLEVSNATGAARDVSLAWNLAL